MGVKVIQQKEADQPAKAVRIILLMNVLVFMVWNYSSVSMQSFMIENFLVSWTALTAGRIWTLLTSVFSHISFLHLFFNMFALFGFGTVLEKVVGTRSFTLFYLIAGIISSLIHCLLSAFFFQQPDISALGASGAISGVILVFALLFPREKIVIFGLIPLPAIWGAFILMGIDLWGLIAQSKGHDLPIGFGAHLGGSAVGLLYYLRFIGGK